MSKYRVLLTNDDGARSPFVAPFLDALSTYSWCAELRPVIPASESSWIAQAATRGKAVRCLTKAFDKHHGFIAHGTPSDCVALGLDNLFPERPDFVFSGVNLGSNAGLPFYLSSGTVGAARQAFVSGLCAAAFSVQVPGEVMKAWVGQDLGALDKIADCWPRIAAVCAKLADALVTNDAWNDADFFSINLPWDASADTPVILTRLERRQYGELFHQLDTENFLHRFSRYRDSEPAVAPEDPGLLEGDLAVLAKGTISVTPIVYDLALKNQASIRRLRAMF